MRRRVGFYVATILSFFSLLLCGAGLGSWIIENDTTRQYTKLPDTNTQKVAYTQDSSGNNNYFTSIESALKHTSSGNVYVIPGTNPTISSDCTIKSGVTLTLPYEDNLKTVHTVEDSGRTSTGDFADYVEYKTRNETGNNKKVFCKSNVTIADGVTLTNNGSIFIGGVLGRSGQAPTGMTVGNYSKITMGSNAKIESTGKITCYGFIKESSKDNDSSVSFSGKGELLQPITVYDYRGGSYSTRAVTHGSMPFNVFDFLNVQTKVMFSGQSKMTGTITVFAKVVATEKIVTSDPVIIGPTNETSLIRYSSGGISYKCNIPKGYLYDDFSKTTPASQINKTTFTVDGNVSIASMSVDVGIAIDTSKYHLPFSYKFAFNFNSGLINVSNKVKFLAGSVVKIGRQATVTIGAETVFYQNYVPAIYTGRGDGYPRYTTSAELINNGTLNIQSSFGGIIQSTFGGSLIKTSGGFSNRVDMTETLDGANLGVTGKEEDHTETAKITLIDKKVFDQTSETGMFYEKASGVLNSDDLASNKTLTSYKLNGIDDYGWYDGSELSNATYGIRYVLNSDTASIDGGIESFNAQNSSYILKSPINLDENLVFDGFSFNANLTEMLDKDANGNSVLETLKAISMLNDKNYITLYAKWDNPSKAHYSVDIETLSTSDHKSEQTNSNSLDLVVGDSFALDKSSNYYIYEKLSVSGDVAKGTLTRKTFDGYDVTVCDSNGNVIKTISLDVNGDSSDGTFSAFSLADTSIVGGNYRVNAKARYVIDSKEFIFTMNVGATTMDPKGSTNISISLDTSTTFDGMKILYTWSTNDSKAEITNKSSQSTILKNNYRGTSISSWWLTETTVSLTCNVTIDGISLGNLSKNMTFKKGNME